MINIIPSIASALSKIKKRKTSKTTSHKNDASYTKEQHLQWIKDGKCQSCGGKTGKYKGICDECRLS